MGYTYDIATSKKDKKSTFGLTICHLIHKLNDIFLSIFLVAHIYSLTNDLYSYAFNVGIYYLSDYVCMFIVYILCSFIVEKTNRIWVYRIANILEACVVIVAIFYGKDLAKIVFLAGVLKGFSRGAYYSSYNVLKQEMVSRKSIAGYAVVLMILSKIVNVVCPVILGALIDVSTFSMTACYVLIFCVIQVIISFMVKSKKPTNSEFNLKDFIKKLKVKNAVNRKIKLIYITAIFYGTTTVTSALLNINIMMHFGSNFSLGMITSIFALVSIVVILFVKKFTKSGWRSWMYITAAIAQVLGAGLFIIMPSVITLIIYNFVFAICEVVVATVFDVIRNKNLKEAGLYEDIAEHQCIIESIFQIVRIVTFALLMTVALLKNYMLFQIAFILFIVLHAIFAVMLAKYEKIEKEED